MASTPKTLARKRFGREIRKLREQTGTSAEAITEMLNWRGDKLGRIEDGGATMVAAEVEALVNLFELDADAAERLRAMGVEARKRSQYGRIADWARTFVEWEAEATEIRCHETALIPGIMQTEAYARALVKGGLSNPAEHEQMVNDRLSRQQVLTREAAPRISAVIGEAAIRCRVGDGKVMAEQLERLLELSEEPYITVQVLPFTAGAYPALGWPFTILTLTHEEITAVYAEDLTSADLLDGPSHVHAYELAFEQAQVGALGPVDSRSLLAKVRDEMRNDG